MTIGRVTTAHEPVRLGEGQGVGSKSERAAFLDLAGSANEAAERRPSAKARPALVVANASKPSTVRMRAVPASQGLGMTKAPGRACKAWNTAAFSAWFSMVVRPPGPMEGSVMSSSLAPRIAA